MSVADRRRRTGDLRIDRAPAGLRHQLASTAERVSSTFEVGARVRDRMADAGGPRADASFPSQPATANWQPITAPGTPGAVA